MRALLLFTVCGVLCGAAATPLDDYVNKPDPAYGWELLSQVRGDGWTGYVLNMTSQRWLRPEEFASQWGHVWVHDMVIIVPDAITQPDAGVLYITGNYDHDGPSNLTATDPHLTYLAHIAVRTGMVGGILFQVPNQNLVFTSDPLRKPRNEDAITALTWWQYLSRQAEPEWVVYLPMTKAAVRGLDTLADFASQHVPGARPQRFVVTGASKRGWTTWLTAAVDRRVVGIIPQVLDALQFEKFLHRHYRSYNGWSFALRDYYAMNITDYIDHPRMAQLASFVDPYSYRDRLTMPKLIIAAVGDEFFLLDDTRYWIKDLPGVSFTYMTPNSEHTMITGIDSVLDAATGFAQAVVKGEQLPQFTWDIDERDGRITVHVSGAQPDKVKMWWGSTVDGKRRDFRWLAIKSPCYTFSVQGACIRPILWLSQDLAARSEGTYVAAMAPPGEGWRAFFMQLKFGDVTVSTPVSVVPDVYPYPDCEGNGCRGELV